MGVEAAANGSYHGDDEVPVVAARALVTSLMVVQRWPHERETKFCEVIQTERWVLDL
jgi:hypothetical protein